MSCGEDDDDDEGVVPDEPDSDENSRKPINMERSPMLKMGFNFNPSGSRPKVFLSDKTKLASEYIQHKEVDIEEMSVRRFETEVDFDDI